MINRQLSIQIGLNIIVVYWVDEITRDYVKEYRKKNCKFIDIFLWKRKFFFSNYLHINGKCNRSASAASNGFIILGNLDGGVLQIELNKCNGPVFRLIDVGVRNFLCSEWDCNRICCVGEILFSNFLFGVLNISTESI